MPEQPIIHDERYYAVENASYRIGFMIMAFGLLILIVIRSIVYQESNWDPFALVIIASGMATIYQAVHKIIHFSWKYVYYAIAAALLAAVVVYIAATFSK